MKKLYKYLFVGLLGLVSNVQAAPHYYTFDGTITAITDDAGAISAAGLNIGDSVSYTYLVDTELQGTETRNDGTHVTIGDSASYDSFYADLVLGSLIDEVDGGYYHEPFNPSGQSYGFNDANGVYARIVSGSVNNYVNVTENLNFNDWTVGSKLRGLELATDSRGASSYYSSALTLTSISASASVPEPSAFLLLGSGLLGIGLTKRGKNHFSIKHGI